MYIGLLTVLSIGLILYASRAQAAPGDVTLGHLATVVVMAGILAMILIETTKRIFPLRSAYARRKLLHWLTLRSRKPGEHTLAMAQLVELLELDLGPSLVRSAIRVDEQAERDLDLDEGARQRAMAENLGRSWSRLWVPGSGLGSPFGLPFEQLTAQIASAVERALREPTRYDALVRIFAPASSLTMRREGGGLPREEGSHVVLQDAAQEVFMSVDQLQTRLSGDWRHSVQLTACVVSGLFAILLVEVGEQPGHVIWYILASLIFGGFIAWLARDLTAIVEHLRR